MGEPAASIGQVADRLDRSYSVVHEAVKVLAEYGIVKYQRDGQSKQPLVPYETIAFDVTIGASLTGSDTEAPA